MRSISLTQGKVALVDDADYERLSRFRWFVYKNKKNWYAGRSVVRPSSGKRGTMQMHREILGAEPGRFVDHIDSNGLNNRRANLRFATHKENNRHRRRDRRRAPYQGVYWHKQRKKWVARISVDNRDIHLGVFATAEAAARVYNRSARENFGEFAVLNAALDRTEGK